MENLERAKDYTKSEIEEIERYLNIRLEEVTRLKDKEVMTERADVLLNVFKMLQNYDEIKPLLTEFLDKKHYKEKWEKEK